jgi:hypothetical protein
MGSSKRTKRAIHKPRAAEHESGHMSAGVSTVRNPKSRKGRQPGQDTTPKGQHGDSDQL